MTLCASSWKVVISLPLLGELVRPSGRDAFTEWEISGAFDGLIPQERNTYRLQVPGGNPRGTRFKEPKTVHGRRTVTLPDLTVEHLRRHKLMQVEGRLRLGPTYHENNLIFPRADGTPWPPDTLSSAFAALIRRSSLPRIRFHDLRHSHASQLLKQGVHPKIVSERLGHSTVAITLDTYSHVLPGLQKDVALGVNGALRQAIQREDGTS